MNRQISYMPSDVLVYGRRRAYRKVHRQRLYRGEDKHESIIWNLFLKTCTILGRLQLATGEAHRQVKYKVHVSWVYSIHHFLVASKSEVRRRLQRKLQRAI